MSRASKILLIIAGVFALAFISIMAVYGFDFSAMGSGTVGGYVKEQHVVENVNQNISVNDENVDIVMGTSPDDKIYITYYENNNEYYEKGLEGDISFKKIYENSSLWGLASAPEFEVLLPRGYSGNLDIKTSNDDIDATGVSFEGGEFTTSNGDVSLSEVKSAGKCDVSTGNGDINVEGSEFSELSSVTSSGDIGLENTTADVAMVLDTHNGDVNVADSTSGTMNVQNSNGDIVMANFFGTDIDLNNSNGKIRGSIAGIIDDFSYTTSVSNGKSNLGNHSSDIAPYTLNATVKNGDLDIEFAK